MEATPTEQDRYTRGAQRSIMGSTADLVARLADADPCRAPDGLSLPTPRYAMPADAWRNY